MSKFLGRGAHDAGAPNKKNKEDAAPADGQSDWERVARERVEDGRLKYAAAQRWAFRCLVAADWF